MSQDRQDTDSNKQVSEPHAGAGESSFAPVVDDVPAHNSKRDSEKDSNKVSTKNSNADSKAEAGFESVTIRSYLAEQFGVREVTTPDQPAAPVAPPTDAKAELAKWRARVPKLASALKQRTEQIELLESELARLQSEASNASAGGPGLQARDEHIAALELKLSGLTTNYQTSEGNLRARDLELEDLRADLLASKQRWQSLTEALDGQVASTDEAQALLASATEQQSTLQAELKAATERQSVVQAELDTLVERESALHTNLNAATERESTLQAELSALTEQESVLQAKFDATVERELTQQAEIATQQQQLTEQGSAVSAAQQALADQRVADALLTEQLEEQLQEQGDTLQEALERLTNLDDRNEKLLETTELANNQLNSLSEDITRLQGELASQAQTFAAQLAEQQQHSQLDTAQIQAEHSERLRDIHAQTLLVFEALERQNIEEQRNGVATMQASLELEMHNDYVDLQQAAQGLMQQLRQTQAQLLDQQRTGEQVDAQQTEARQRDTNAHRQDLAEVTLALEAEISVLQERLQQQEQQASLDDEARPRVTILGEISDANEGRSDFEQAWSGLDGRSADEANDTIHELERLLKIRNEELSAAVAARVHFLPATAPVTPFSSSIISDGPASDSTLDMAAADSDSDSTTSGSATVASLHEQVNLARAENERLRQQLERTSASLLASDDLTQLKGVGGKMAEQLRELGISQFAQMAALDLADLDASDHPLYNLRSRIERNGWIQQAKALVHPLTLYGER